VLTKRKETKTTERLWFGGRRKKSENPERARRRWWWSGGARRPADRRRSAALQPAEMYEALLYSVAAEREREKIAKKAKAAVSYFTRQETDRSRRISAFNKSCFSSVFADFFRVAPGARFRDFEPLFLA